VKRSIIAAAILGLAFAGWTWRERRAANDGACEILSRFRKGSLEPSPEEVLALRELSLAPYAVRRAALVNLYSTSCPSVAFIFRDHLYIAATRLDAPTLRRLAPVLPGGYGRSLAYEADAGAALDSLASHRPTRIDAENRWAEANWVDNLKSVADRLPNRRAEIEEEWIVPRLFTSPPLRQRPDFISYLSDETRRRHIPEIRDSLWEAARSSDSGARGLATEQAIALADLIGDTYGGYITDAVIAWPWSVSGAFGQRERDAQLLGTLVSRFRPRLAARLLQEALGRAHSTPSPQLDDRHPLHSFNIRHHGKLIQSFVQGLDGDALTSAKRVLLPQWLAETEWVRVGSLARAIAGCAPAMDESERVAVLRHAIRYYEAAPDTQRLLELQILIARILPSLPLLFAAERTKAQEILAEAFDPFDLERLVAAFADEPLAGWSADLGFELLIRWVDLHHLFLESPPNLEPARALCRALPRSHRQRTAEEMVAALQKRAGNVAAVQAAACLSELAPGAAALEAALEIVTDSLARLPDDLPSSQARSAALRALAILAQESSDPLRRSQILQLALDASATVVQPACAELAALASGDDVESIARIIRMPNCSRMDRSRVLMDLAERLGMPRDAFGRPRITSAMLPTFDEDLVRVAHWLEGLGL
jgi:hypothetical protein